MATNYLRESYDQNIARNPSFCKMCNYGCLCDGPKNLCSSCVHEGTWYYDRNTN